MILSIGMIVKNEEKYLEQCLTALKPILENVPSELIIADTGSSDKTVEIAKRFTDKVYHFDWIDDFSAARNFTLEKSTGEWFMFIDADEILQNCDDIIRFFNSGEYNKYNTASYIQRSYSDIANGKVNTSQYIDMKVLRLTKRLNGVYFINTIHETFSLIYAPVKYLDLVADHYGYVEKVDGKITEKSKEKKRRNLDLLFKRLDQLTPEEKKHTAVYKQIADCYKTDDHEKAIEFLDMGLAAIEPTDMIITSYYVSKAGLLLYMNRYKETVELCDKYFDPGNPVRKTQLACDATMFDCRGGSCYFLEYYDKAVFDLSNFFEVYGKYLDNKMNTDDLFHTPVYFSNEHIQQVMLVFFESCIITGKYGVANKVINSFPVYRYCDSGDNTLMLMAKLVGIMERTDFDAFGVLYSNLDDDNREKLVCFMRLLTFKADHAEREKILGEINAAAKSSSKLSEAADICREFLSDKIANNDKIENYLNKYSSGHNDDILCVMMGQNMDITPFLNQKDFDARRCIHTVNAGYHNFLSLFENYDTGKISESGLEKAAELYKWALAESVGNNADISVLLEKYGSVGERWRRNSNGKSGVPKEIQPAIIVWNIVCAGGKNNYKLCLSEMRKLITSFPEFTPIAKAYQTLLENAIKPVQDPLSEFEQMALAVKQNIRAMIQAGNISDAKNTLHEYEALCPNDAEIAKLKTEIEALS